MSRQPIINANFLESESIASYDWAFIGTATIGGLRIDAAMFETGKAKFGEEDPFKATSIVIKEGYEFLLSEFKKSYIISIDGHPIIREQVIKYVAHKKGGVHYDNHRKTGETEFKLLDSSLNIRLGGSLIFEKGKPVPSGGLPLPYVALLSIAQSIVLSSDIDHLLNASRSILSQTPYQF